MNNYCGFSREKSIPTMFVIIHAFSYLDSQCKHANLVSWKPVLEYWDIVPIGFKIKKD